MPASPRCYRAAAGITQLLQFRQSVFLVEKAWLHPICPLHVQSLLLCPKRGIIRDAHKSSEMLSRRSASRCSATGAAHRPCGLRAVGAPVEKRCFLFVALVRQSGHRRLFPITGGRGRAPDRRSCGLVALFPRPQDRSRIRLTAGALKPYRPQRVGQSHRHSQMQESIA